MLRRLNKNKFGNLPQRTREAFYVLCDKQKEALLSPTETTFDEAAEAMTVWNHWAGIEESFLRQKSRITWLKNGDQNTLFFFKIFQTRTSFNGSKWWLLHISKASSNRALSTLPPRQLRICLTYWTSDALHTLLSCSFTLYRRLRLKMCCSPCPPTKLLALTGSRLSSIVHRGI